MTKEWGNGMWTTIHIMAADASRNPKKFDTFVDTVKNLLKNIPCKDCREHAGDYLNGHPLESCADSFIWSWRFHNTVNKRLEKPEMDYSTARKIFINGEMQSLCKGSDGKQCDKSDSNGVVKLEESFIKSAPVHRSQFKSRR